MATVVVSFFLTSILLFPATATEIGQPSYLQKDYNLVLMDITDSTVETSDSSLSIELGKMIDGEFFQLNSFSPSDMVTIKFLRFDSSPVTSFSVFVADIDVTDYVIQNGTVTIGDSYIEVFLPEFPAMAISEATGTMDNLITLTVNSQSYSTILSIDRHGQPRAIQFGALAVACASGAAASAGVELFDIFFDTKWYGVFPYPAYNGREMSFTTIYAERGNIVSSAIGGCLTGSGLKLLKGAKFAEDFKKKVTNYLLAQIDKAQAVLSPLLSKLKVDIAALAKKTFSKQVKEAPGLIVDFAKKLLKGLFLETYVKELLSGAETYKVKLTITKPANGTIKGDGNINCGVNGSTCEATFDNNKTVSLNAIPAPGMTFKNWASDCSGSKNPFPLTMNGDKIDLLHNLKKKYHNNGQKLRG